MTDKKKSKEQNQPVQKKPGEERQNKFHWKQAGKTSLVWVVILVSAIFLSNLFTAGNRNEVQIQFFEYQEFLNAGAILEAEVVEKEFHGKLKEPQEVVREGQKIGEYSNFVVTLPYVNESVLAEWDKNSVRYSFKEKKVDWLSYLLSMVPWLLLIVFWIFIMRRMQGGVGGNSLFNFGRSRARLWVEDKPDINFDRVAGCQEAKQELSEIITFLKNPDHYQKLGGRIPKGVLLLGPPGTGKTLLARAVAGEAGVPFFSLSGADFVEMFVGVGASRVRDLFEQGKKNAPSIIFIDEIDAVGRHRGAGLGGGHDEREQTLNALLVEMDGFESTTNIILIAATNRPDVLDSALLRPGRFDRQVVVDIPDLRGRKGILEVHTKDIPLAKDADMEVLAKGTPGLVGADLANLVNEASLLAARDGKSKVSMEDFESAKDKVMMGVERKSMIISDEEKELTAYHESGHALMAKLLPEADPVHKVSIIPRGRALGITAQLPMDEKHNYSQSYIDTRLRVLLGGRAAEQLIFNELTTGAGNDIEVATEMARKMVCEWGMSSLLGPLTFGKKDEEIFLGREIATNRDYSETTARKIDEEVTRIIREAEDEAMKLLKKNEQSLQRVAKELLKHETIDGDDLDKIMAGKTLRRRRTKKANGAKDGKAKNATTKGSKTKKMAEKSA
ncbi:MAG: ATP-dependent zinc metalloprotease FtsH [Candidatus Neomarinimicrobiota bacterium]|nr:ATP-dependent zinc metalloprotease FtsH [Candidatus Neomarinimicrobiota bacterium]